MRALKFIGLFVLILAIVVCALGLMSPKKIQVSKSVIIEAAPALVAEQMLQLKNWDHWNPFYEHDTTLTISFKETPGQRLEWKSQQEQCSGTVTAAAATEQQLNYEVQLQQSGMETLLGHTGKGYMKVENTGNGKVKASWSYEQEVSFPANTLILLWNTDKTLGRHFEHGLQQLKLYVESGAAAVTSPPTVSNDYVIDSITFAPRLYAIVRKTVPHHQLIAFFSDSYEQLEGPNDTVINGPRVGIFYKWDIVNKKADLAAGFPVRDKIKGKQQYATIPESPAYKIIHKGGYKSSHAAHEAMGKYLMAKGKKPGLSIEEYISGPFNETDSLKWVTNIYYLAP